MLQHALSRAVIAYARHVQLSRSQLLGPAQKIPALATTLHASHQATHVRTLHSAQSQKLWPRPVTGNDTIYAVSTAPGRAGIAIVRISGPACLEIYSALCPGKREPEYRYAGVRTLYDPSSTTTNILDTNALVIRFEAPKTVTGEDVMELHIHGGPATVKAVLSSIPQCAARHLVRYAEPGEFTRRAFENNRLDLAQVEALSDTLSAETEQQRRAAVRGNSKVLGRTYEGWRQQLLAARGEMEALIDFSEDQHFDESPAELVSSISGQVDTMLQAIVEHEVASHRGELLKRGIRISLLGPPNAGKSSLLNQIVGREASIVSQEAGTTRDVIEVSLDIRGYFCTFADTAGLRTDHTVHPEKQSDAVTIGVIEREGIRRAKEKASESDLIIALASIEPLPHSEGWYIHYDAETISLATSASGAVLVVNKCDRLSTDELKNLLTDFGSRIHSEANNIPLVGISCLDILEKQRSNNKALGNIHNLTTHLVGIFESMTSLPIDMEDLLGVTERQRQLLSACSRHLGEFLEESRERDGGEFDIVLAAEHLRSAANCLARITGRGSAGDVEEVLGVVFEKFCVGK